MIIRKKLSDTRWLAVTALVLVCLGCSAQTSWQSPLLRDHELVGRIWLSEQNRFISRSELISLVQQRSLLLLGEKHDNPDHHRLRLELLRAVLLPDGRSQVVLEMMERSQQVAIDTLVAGKLPSDDTTLADRLDWDTEGWPWALYGPVVKLALQRDAGIRAGNINRSEVMQIYSNSEDGEAIRGLNTEQLAQLERDIDSSHCGMLPPGQFPAMVRVQQARDKRMADALMSGIDRFDQAILLAGNYHIRHDLGVPNYLDHQLDHQISEPPLSIAFLEVDPDQTHPEAYLQRFSQQNAYDVIWFTPALRQNDYCADMRASQSQ
ncbi:MAG: ChaN family lipoprotein [Pseudohongiella sp.]|uniref:ChaN family lipoprotein n=1 Tax=Pseudohongiella sp. TaxID=1979412 RepID=UPI0034A08B41